MSKKGDTLRYTKAFQKQKEWLQHPQEGTSKQEPQKPSKHVRLNQQKDELVSMAWFNGSVESIQTIQSMAVTSHLRYYLSYTHKVNSSPCIVRP